ncbi:PREDICTED: GDSL esterase/lipase At1g71691 [Populus euphratica]|uniref:GDSL esterase/lipase At1g71691 n=1 Tax=Populus euphratica TaxID=75702 RepID=A0AAJ6U4N3_POPEU|nr:PREDICTED: GDSL esterase/lipase At1g71691 [Populus euphratica]
MSTSLLLPLLLLLLSSFFTRSRNLAVPQELNNLSQNIITYNIPAISPTSSLVVSSSISPSPTPTTLPVSPPLVPAFFIFGDSSVDCGTNNYLGTFARADHSPYGRDFDTRKPTGRFCNGRVPVDYLALRLGLPFVPSYLGQMGTFEDMIKGVNYASAGAGVIFSSGSELGQRISFTQQIQQFSDTLQSFILNMGEAAANELISNSVFYISIGVNDYIHYYLRNASNIQNLYLPWSFNQFIAASIRQEIKNLYNMNVRRVILMGLPPIEYNFVMRYMIEELGLKLPDAKITFCGMYEGSMDIIKNHELYGFNVTADACCGLGKYKGWILCFASEIACSNATNHIWWDQYHPTDAVNAILADNVWNGLHTKMCYPMNLEDMVAPRTK